MRLLDGRAIAADLGELVGKEAAALREAGVTPTLVVVLPGEDPAARSYVRVIERAAERVGVAVTVEQPAAGVEPDDAGEVLLRRLDELADDPAVHGVMVQTPLPTGVRAADAGARITPAKDVDGMNPLSAGRVALGLPGFAPATAAAVLEILHRAEVPLRGARAVVIGRSAVVGKPAALLLLAEDATVTVCHSKTGDLPAVAREADVLVVAIGRARMVDATYVKPGATVIDVGTNWTTDGMVGDVDATSVEPVAGALTPVPGGVGPVTTMLLLRNTVLAAREQQGG